RTSACAGSRSTRHTSSSASSPRSGSFSSRRRKRNPPRRRRSWPNPAAPSPRAAQHRARQGAVARTEPLAYARGAEFLVPVKELEGLVQVLVRELHLAAVELRQARLVRRVETEILVVPGGTPNLHRLRRELEDVLVLAALLEDLRAQ